jgi:hypothetical protein
MRVVMLGARAIGGVVGGPVASGLLPEPITEMARRRHPPGRSTVRERRARLAR